MFVPVFLIRLVCSPVLGQLASVDLRVLCLSCTKSDSIKVSNSMQSYLISNELSCEEKQFLFSLRTRTFDCKANYSHKFNNNLNCLICHDSVDEQQHLLLCPKLTSGVDLNNIKYEDIFGSVKKTNCCNKSTQKVSRKKSDYYQWFLHCWRPGASSLMPHVHYVYDMDKYILESFFYLRGV